MNKQKLNTEKQFHFDSNKNFVHFDNFRLSKHNLDLIDLIHYPEQKYQKVKSLILGCVKRNNKLLYKGEKYYIEDLQVILNKFPQLAPAIMRALNINISKSSQHVFVQCHNCANYTQVWKFCPTCQNTHYCHQGCQMKIKFTHQRQQCRIRPFPKLYKPLQIQLHIGSDLGKNLYCNFQHQVSMSLLIRGQKLLEKILQSFSTIQGKALLDDYEVKKENKMIKFEKQIKNPHVGQQNISIQKMQDIITLYTNNKILRKWCHFMEEYQINS